MDEYAAYVGEREEFYAKYKEMKHEQGIGHCWHQVYFAMKPTEMFKCCSCGDVFADNEVAKELERQSEENARA